MSNVAALAGPPSARTSSRPTAVPVRDHAANVVGLRQTPTLFPTGHTLIEKNGFLIRVADAGRFNAVDTLVRRMYGQRGYRLTDCAPARSAPRSTSITLEAVCGRTTIGTLTVNVADTCGLNAEALYPEEIAPYRRAGLRPCEFNRLAMSMDDSSKEALAGIFHVGIVFAFKIFRATDLFIEVNPRHAPFYRRKIGFSPLGEQRICPRVNAPAVLLHKNLAVCTEELSRLGGLRDPSNRSFYAFALTPEEERTVVGNIIGDPIRMAS